MRTLVRYIRSKNVHALTNKFRTYLQSAPVEQLIDQATTVIMMCQRLRQDVKQTDAYQDNNLAKAAGGVGVGVGGLGVIGGIATIVVCIATAGAAIPVAAAVVGGGALIASGGAAVAAGAVTINRALCNQAQLGRVLRHLEFIQTKAADISQKLQRLDCYSYEDVDMSDGTAVCEAIIAECTEAAKLRLYDP